MLTVAVTAFWDDEADVWVAQSDDIPGLITEAASMDLLVSKLRGLIPELLRENGRSVAHVKFELKASLTGVTHAEPA